MMAASTPTLKMCLYELFKLPKRVGDVRLLMTDRRLKTSLEFLIFTLLAATWSENENVFQLRKVQLSVADSFRSLIQTNWLCENFFEIKFTNS